MTRNARAYLIVVAALAVIAWLGSAPARAAERWGPYPARVVEIKDGDTFTALIKVFPGRLGDLGSYVARDVRIDQVNTPENPGQCEEETTLATRAESRLAELIGRADAMVIVTVHDVDSWGRPVATVRAGGRDVGQVLLDEGLAREYADGQWRDGYWCDEVNPQQRGE